MCEYLFVYKYFNTMVLQKLSNKNNRNNITIKAKKKCYIYIRNKNG